MTHQYLTTEKPESFAVPGDIDKPVLLNPHKLKFLLLAEPSVDEVAESIEEHATKRLEDRWLEMMELNNPGKVILALQVKEPHLRALPQDQVLRLLDATGPKSFAERICKLSFDEQRKLVAPLKPRTTAEMLALYQDTSHIDQTGYRYLRHELSKANSVSEFFGNLTTTIFTGIADTDYTLATPKQGVHQARIFEYLGMAVDRGWLLFPFITGESGTNEMRALMHRGNARRYLNPLYGPQQQVQFFESLTALAKTEKERSLAYKYAKYLSVCSTLRSISQSSTALFTRWRGASEQRQA